MTNKLKKALETAKSGVKSAGKALLSPKKASAQSSISQQRKQEFDDYVANSGNSWTDPTGKKHNAPGQGPTGQPRVWASEGVYDRQPSGDWTPASDKKDYYPLPSDPDSSDWIKYGGSSPR